MSGELVIFLGRRTLETALLVVAPVMIVAMGLGLLVSLLQAITSIRDMSLTIIPKIAGIGITIMIAGGWMLQQAVSFTQEVFDAIMLMTQ
ncbi:MAG: flagellar type III secretion system protein FliQ [Planctomycetes bacterium]|jgi:flagellar biosynthetic protein FliQ|nr:flagellar type III secretion system protein FliQ [Planctomycetota bacterium]